jgi:LPXTG-motif cell wall-anchored protein
VLSGFSTWTITLIVAGVIVLGLLVSGLLIRARKRRRAE